MSQLLFDDPSFAAPPPPTMTRRFRKPLPATTFNFTRPDYRDAFNPPPSGAAAEVEQPLVGSDHAIGPGENDLLDAEQEQTFVPTDPQPSTTELVIAAPAEEKPNYLLWGGIGIGALIVIGGGIYLLKK